MKKLAVFASGNGSNFQAILDSINSGNLDAKIELLVCNKENAYAIKRAEMAGIKTYVFNPREFTSKTEYEKLILSELTKHSIDYIALAGYMLLIGETLLSEYEGRIINIHPSLLPAFKGKDAIQQAVNYGVKVMGVTIHYVDSGMDSGKIIAQESFILEGNENILELESKIHSIEHALYPKVLQKLLTEVE